MQVTRSDGFTYPMLIPDKQGSSYGGRLISPSALSLFDDTKENGCQRRWAFRYLTEQPREPQTPAQELGDEIEQYQLHRMLLKALPIDFTRPSGEIVAPGISYLPMPLRDMAILNWTPYELQHRAEFPSPRGTHGYHGYFDLYAPDGKVVPGGESGVPHIVDFKSTSDLKYAKTEEDLRTDAQAVIYAVDTLYKTRAPHVDLTWIYFQTKGPRRAKRTHLRMLADDALRAFEPYDALGARMTELRAEMPNPLDLPFNAYACESYNKTCEFSHLCNLSPAQKLASYEARSEKVDLPMNASTNLLANLQSRAGIVPQAAQPAPEPPAADPQRAALEEYVRQNPHAAFLLGNPPTAQQPALAPAFVPPAINPPESALPPAQPTGIAAAPAIALPTPKRGRPAKAAAADVEVPDVDFSKYVTFAKAVRAGIDTFLAGIGE